MITPTPEDEAALDATKAPLMEHLLELRKRLIWAMVSFGICFVICFAFATPIFNFLTGRCTAATNHLIYTALTEVFFTQVKIGMFGGICLGFPVIAAQIWIFVAPGLYRHEKRAFLPFLMWTPVMFIMGAAFVYYVMLPFSIKFFGSYQVPTTRRRDGHPAAGQGQRLSRFRDDPDVRLRPDLPVAGAAVAAGQGRHRHRQGAARHAPLCHVGLFAVAAIFTPPDAISMMSLAVPLVALYEISILSVVMIERGKRQGRGGARGQADADCRR